MIKQTWANGNFFLPRTREIWRGSCVFGNLDKTDTEKHFHTSDIFVNEILVICAEVNFSQNISPYSITKHSASGITL